MTAEPTILVRPVEVERIIDLRHRVLRQGLPREAAVFAGDSAPGSIPFAALLEEAVVGCATLHESSFEGQPAFQLRGMAVDPAHQRRGVGRLLLEEAHRLAGSKPIWANCRTPAVPFYQRFGWRIISDEFVIETAGPHFRMVGMRD